MKAGWIFLVISFLLAGCGNVEWFSSATTNNGTSTTLVPGQTVTMAENSYVMVPAGTTVSSGGGKITIYGHNNTVHTQAGAIVSVPSTANDAPDNTVTTQ